MSGPSGKALEKLASERLPLFWAKVDRSGECWDWTAALDIGGYGVFNIGARMARAHRVSWVLENGPLPEGSTVLHRCDNRRCVRPKHLYLGTMRENVADMDARGRRGHGWHPTRKGQEHQAARLSDETVAAIRAAMAAGGKQRHVAARFGVSHTYVGMLVRGEKRV
jgi:hypothetical protein